MMPAPAGYRWTRRAADLTLALSALVALMLTPVALAYVAPLLAH